MKKRQILWAIVFGSMLAITGCGDDDTGSGGSDGASKSSCEAICGSTCAFEGVDPTNMEFAECVSLCNESLPQFNDNCGSQGDALLGCLEANGCDENTENCNSQAIAWGLCISDAFQ